ncbi:MAG: GTP-binding protein [Planctomycetota bacterium]
MSDPRPGAAGRVPVILVTGFLGAGKTTLVNRILTQRHGERIAVIVNEFGEAGIDGRLVVGADEEVLELVNGCLCCTVRGDLVRAVGELLRRRRRRFGSTPFARLLVETSGLASPGPVLQTFALEADLAAETVPAGVVCLAHAAHVASELARHPEAEEQVGYAQVVLLNHRDAVRAAAAEDARRAIAARNPLAVVWETTRAAVAIDRLLAAAAAATAEPVPAPAHVHPSPGGGAGAIVLRARKPLDLHRLKIWLQFLAADRRHELWRVKGLFASGDPPRAVVAQGIYQVLELGPGPGEPPAESVLVLIGRGLDRAEIDRGWAVVTGP